MQEKTPLAGGLPITPWQAGARHSVEARDKVEALPWRRSVFVVFCLALLAWQPAEAARRRDVGSAPLVGGAGQNFAIADFDGDSLPDFATVQPGLAMASWTNYRIQFEFSLGNKRSFAVSAPTGGLQIASRDVNGDSFLDLVISTRLANEPVAVLLNDGRGNFTLADAKGFAAALWDARQEWHCAAECLCGDESAMVSASWEAGILAAENCVRSPATAAAAALAPATANYSIVPHEIRGRAPPQP
jgi:hypothetical protein